jgi:hypothetical protein
MIQTTHVPVYLTGVSNNYTRQAADGDMYGRLGLLVGPDTGGTSRAKADYLPHIPSYHTWAADNGCFSRSGEFDEREWLDMLERAVNEIEGAHEDCLFAVAPDVFDPKKKRGDPVATIERSRPVFPKIRDLGLRAALVLQDGLEVLYHKIPWDEFDTAFIGGGDAFKLGYPTKKVRGIPYYHADPLATETRRWAELIYKCHVQGKDLHVGRVNSYARLCFAIEIGADSVDGTFIAFGGEKNLNRIRSWYKRLNRPHDAVRKAIEQFMKEEGVEI